MSLRREDSAPYADLIEVAGYIKALKATGEHRGIRLDTLRNPKRVREAGQRELSPGVRTQIAIDKQDASTIQALSKRFRQIALEMLRRALEDKEPPSPVIKRILAYVTNDPRLQAKVHDPHKGAQSITLEECQTALGNAISETGDAVLRGFSPECLRKLAQEIANEEVNRNLIQEGTALIATGERIK